MQIKSFLIGAVVASVVTVGAAVMFLRPGPLTADKCYLETDCVITVSVTNTEPCVASVDKKDFEVKQNYYTLFGLSHLIRWELDADAIAAGFRFDQRTGVELKSTSPDPDNQFFGQGPRNKKTQFHWRDKNTNTHEYKYDVNIVRSNGVACTKLDPAFYNN